MRNEEELTNISMLIRSGRLEEGPIVMSLEELRLFYEIFIQANDRRIPEVVIVNLADQAFLIFPEWSRQEIIVESNEPLVPEDFQFIPDIDWRGAKTPPQRFPSFFVQEFWLSKFRTITVFLVSFVILMLVVRSTDVLDLISSLLIEASAVFLSIYLIFTVSQSERLSYDKKLFERGIFFKYHNDDKNITKFAILTIAFVFVNALIGHLPPIADSLSKPLSLSVGRWIISLTSAFVLTMLFHTFFIVAGYYLERTRDLAEREHTGRILHEEYSARHSEE